MLSVSEALEKILVHFSPLPAQPVSIQNALGRVLASKVASGYDLPHFNNSSVDGFAVRWQDTLSASPSSPVQLAVIADIPAGSMSDLTLSAGQAARIMTGAPIPDGADAVVMVEDTNQSRVPSGSPLPATVAVGKAVSASENIRNKGDDLAAGQVVLTAGHMLRPQDVGMLAMLGIAEVAVHRRPRVAILSSGDELVAPGRSLQPGQIHDSNNPMLEALVQQAGCEVINLGVARDNLQDVSRVFSSAIQQQPDLIISTAGVGTGVFDYIRNVVDQNGGLSFWRVNMRPGKPLAFGNVAGIPFFGLPGNPVSSYVSFQVFVRPALAILRGLEGLPFTTIRARLSHDLSSDGRQSYLRAIVSTEASGYQASLAGHQGSGNLFSTVQANALLIIPAGVTSCPANSVWDAWLLDS